ncbi:jg26876 [Pararge aegeria aegeria]|uniref:Jg26876 protein n=1 Tax=Pararge aegeria aegeria TaxID=348720 RepID=A0A8S4S9B7_9NEOP|nr:jg26876 [Pararge aegeria aegeria]
MEAGRAFQILAVRISNEDAKRFVRVRGISTTYIYMDLLVKISVVLFDVICPPKRWTDDNKRVAKAAGDWTKAAQDCGIWNSPEKTNAQQWTSIV